MDENDATMDVGALALPKKADVGDLIKPKLDETIMKNGGLVGLGGGDLNDVSSVNNILIV